MITPICPMSYSKNQFISSIKLHPLLYINHAEPTNAVHSHQNSTFSFNFLTISGAPFDHSTNHWFSSKAYFHSNSDQGSGIHRNNQIKLLQIQKKQKLPVEGWASRWEESCPDERRSSADHRMPNSRQRHRSFAIFPPFFTSLSFIKEFVCMQRTERWFIIILF